MEGCTEYFQLKLMILDKELKFARNGILDKQIRIFHCLVEINSFGKMCTQRNEKYFNIVIYF